MRGRRFSGYNAPVIIHEPEIAIESGEAVNSARIEFAQRATDVPQHLWFKIPETKRDYFSATSESFAAAMLLTSMHRGEDLEIRGEVSARFAYGFLEYMQVFNIWNANAYKKIDIKFHQIRPTEAPTNRGRVLSAYSGGIDSNFTLKSILEDHTAGSPYRITHSIFLQGIDYSLDEGRAYESAYDRYSKIYDDLDLELIPLRTNAALFSQYQISQIWKYGGIIIGAALSLGGGFDRFYMSSSYPYTKLIPNGSLAVIDHLLTSEEMEIIHYGGAHTRFEKIKAIADWGPAKNNLRVCTRVPNEMNGNNCSRCSKCYSTKLRMELLGLLEEFPTLSSPFRLSVFFPWATNPAGFNTIYELLTMAFQKRRWVYVPGILLLWAGGMIRKWSLLAVRKILGNERMFRIKRWYYGRQKLKGAQVRPHP